MVSLLILSYKGRVMLCAQSQTGYVTANSRFQAFMRIYSLLVANRVHACVSLIVTFCFIQMCLSTQHCHCGSQCEVNVVTYLPHNKGVFITCQISV